MHRPPTTHSSTAMPPLSDSSHRPYRRLIILALVACLLVSLAGAATYYQIQLRRGTAAEWTAANTTLAVGEPGYETDTGKLKIGDGSTAWTLLSYFSGSGAGTGDVVGPASATDNAIARYNGITGESIQDSPNATISDLGVITAPSFVGDLTGTASNATYATAAGTAPNATYADGAGNADTLDGSHAADFAADGHAHDAAYISIVSTLTAGNLTKLSAGGEIVDALYAAADFALAIHTHAGTDITSAVANATYATTAAQILGAGVSGSVANATYATTAGGILAAGVSGSVANASFCDYAVSAGATGGTAANATYADTADLLDGYHAGDFAASAHDHSAYAANDSALAAVDSAFALNFSAQDSVNAALAANDSATPANATYADLAGYAAAAGTVSGTVDNATHATLAGYAATAGSATNATAADILVGGTIGNASYATLAGYSATAGSATNATSATILIGGTIGNATYATLAGTAAAVGAHTDEFYLPSGAALISANLTGISMAIVETGAGSMYLPIWLDKDTQENFTFQTRWPGNYNGGTFTAAIDWIPGAASNDCVWSIEALSRGDNEDPNLAWGNVVSVTDTAQTANSVHQTAVSDAITSAGTPAAGEVLILKVARNATAAGDTLDADAGFLGIALRYTSTGVAAA